jgi:uncharacterized membrane protein YkvA (DUF1232 family)
MLRSLRYVVMFWKVRRDRRVRAAMEALGALSWPQRGRFVAALASDPRLPWKVRIAPLLLAAYIASPVDLIPDFIPLLGQIDDVVVMGFVFKLIQDALPPALIEEHLQRAAQSNP